MVAGVGRLKQRSTEIALGEMLKLLSSNPEKNLIRMARLAETLGTSEYQRHNAKVWREYFEKGLHQDPPPVAIQLILRAIHSTSSRYLSRTVSNLLVNSLWQGGARRSAWEQANDAKAPFIILMSPTMRCNLDCAGCYAGEYDQKDDLAMEVVDRIVAEGRELGIYAYTMLGGEPFIRKDVLDLFERNSDCDFLVFSNGSLIDDAVATRLAKAANVAICFSIDGCEESNDARRGPGALKRTERAMALLRENKIPFGFSTMVTSRNYLEAASDEYCDYLIGQGCLFGFHFLYMPVGADPDLSLMPTPEQREYLRVNGAERIRSEKPLFVMDFWNDAPHVGGCIAGGRAYMHITSTGDVEPCIFTHFAADNIKEKSLAEVLKSPFFRSIQTQQPFSDNLLRPCMLIDEPHVIRDAVCSTGAHPTHTGAQDLITTYAEALDEYAAGFKELADQAWATLRPHEVPYGTAADVAVAEVAGADAVLVEPVTDESEAGSYAGEAEVEEADADKAGEYAAAAR
jgi:MoaA/NifB/PqqE/SkfB family radical SAM enzyme